MPWLVFIKWNKYLTWSLFFFQAKIILCSIGKHWSFVLFSNKATSRVNGPVGTCRTEWNQLSSNC